MNFLSGQDDFFRTGNQPISVRHLSQPYNNIENLQRKALTSDNEHSNFQKLFVERQSLWRVTDRKHKVGTLPPVF